MKIIPVLDDGQKSNFLPRWNVTGFICINEKIGHLQPKTSMYSSAFIVSVEFCVGKHSIGIFDAISKYSFDSFES